MLYSKNQFYELHEGKMQEVLDSFAPNSIDCIVTDPPYELGFMGKSWDSSGVAFQKDTWAKCLRVLKPGGHLLAFGGSRTFHRIACAIEDSGFEIRDTIMYIYGSGFPKGENIGLAIDKKLGVENRTGVIKTDGSCTVNGDSFLADKMKHLKPSYEERVSTTKWGGVEYKPQTCV